MAIAAHPPAPWYYCAPLNSKSILNFEYLFTSMEREPCELLVSEFLAKYTDDKHFSQFDI